MKERILITGAGGFLGKHVCKVFSQLSDYEVVKVSSSDYNLLGESDTSAMFREIEPNYVIHLAARSGGIYSNRREPADYFYKNNLILTQTFHYAHLHGVKKILVPIGGCSYPADAVSPISEEAMWKGFPQIQSAGYSVAKKMILVQSWAYKEQYGFQSTIIIPGNLYGEYDNYSYTDSHVIPAMIRKLYEAKLNGVKTVTFWGSGKPERDFVYAGDVARLFPYFLFDYKGDSPINISSGKSCSIQELSDKISIILGYSGNIIWDSTHPDGQMVKIFSVKKLNSLNKSCDTQLEDGLKKTIQWFIENYPNVRL